MASFCCESCWSWCYIHAPIIKRFAARNDGTTCRRSAIVKQYIVYTRTYFTEIAPVLVWTGSRNHWIVRSSFHSFAASRHTLESLCFYKVHVEVSAWLVALISMAYVKHQLHSWVRNKQAQRVYAACCQEAYLRCKYWGRCIWIIMSHPPERGHLLLSQPGHLLCVNILLSWQWSYVNNLR